MKKTVLFFLLLIMVVSVLQGCGSKTVIRRTNDELMADAEKFSQERKYDKAISSLKRVRESYPPPELAARAEIKIADAYFNNKDYIEAAAEYDGFRKLYPKHERAGYALFKQGLSYYRQVGKIDTDQTPVKNAQITFDSYLLQYPDGEHTTEARDNIKDCIDRQLQYEIYVGNFYLRTDKPKAALGRFEKAFKDFPGMKSRDSLYLNLGKAYLATDQKQKCRETLELLFKEFPGSIYIKPAKGVMDKCQ